MGKFFVFDVQWLIFFSRDPLKYNVVGIFLHASSLGCLLES
jgi:hypothetical protein